MGITLKKLNIIFKISISLQILQLSQEKCVPLYKRIIEL